MPAYEVTVSIPERSSTSDGKVPVEITAQYTFGEPVNGNGVFEIESYYSTPLRRDVSIVDGHASFELDMQTDLQVQQWGSYYNYVFSMNDTILNSAGFTQGNFQVVPFSKTIELIGNNYLNQGSPYDYTVIVRNFDGSPAAQGTKVTITIYPGGAQQTVILNADGMASSSIPVAAETSYISLTAEAKDAQPGYLYAYTNNAGSVSSIGLTVVTQE